MSLAPLSLDLLPPSTAMSSSAIRRILVAIKYPTAETPVSVFKAAQLAKGLHAELSLFHAIDQPLCADDCPGIGSKTADDERRIRTRLLQNLTTQAAPLTAEGLAVSVAAEWDYPAHEAVLRQAHRVDADLIVTERHPPGALHSADWQLLRLSQKPVLIVTDHEDERLYRQPVIVAAIDPLHRHATPTDLNENICRLAQTFSTALEGSWYGLHAYATGSHGILQRLSGGNAVEESKRAQALAAVNQLLQSVALTPRAVRLFNGTPVDAVAASTLELHASLLVMGALSRSGIERMLIGNTAEQVMDRIACDVLIVKPEHFGIHFSRHVQGARRLPMSTRSSMA